MNNDKTCHPETLALHYRIDNSVTRPVATPIYQNSAFSADSPYFYTRKSNPNSVELEGALAILEKAEHVISTTTGMSALNLVLQLLHPGDHLVVNKHIYGCSYKLFQRHAEQYGLKLSLLDLSCEEGQELIPADVAMIILETPTNPFLKTVPIRKIAELAAARNPACLIVVDNTWATPLFQKPLENGAHISLASATKYISGHSDVMGGYIAVNDENLAEELRQTRFYTGAILDPHSAWLLRRSLHTFPLRMREHVRVTARLAEFLQPRPEVAKVYLPEVDGEQLRDYGGILFFQLQPELCRRYSEFARALTLFDTGTGMACVSSMVAQPWSGSHASMTTEEKLAMGLDEGLVRLCFGFEKPEDLIADLERAFTSLTSG
ncbi:MAG: PLP-dependent transferase [Geobacteraceae bacterium]|nr:PLP-dependent transferase [Geobacteraceae bacterium]